MLKFPHLKKKHKTKSADDKKHMDRVASLGCIVSVNHACCGRITVHHCDTYMGGGRNHQKTIPLCWNMHLGPEGIDGKQISKRAWQQKYGTETEHLEKVSKLLST